MKPVITASLVILSLLALNSYAALKTVTLRNHVCAYKEGETIASCNDNQSQTKVKFSFKGTGSCPKDVELPSNQGPVAINIAGDCVLQTIEMSMTDQPCLGSVCAYPLKPSNNDYEIKDDDIERGRIVLFTTQTKGKAAHWEDGKFIPGEWEWKGFAYASSPQQ